ncbi:RHS repeat-associated core domain-containing protein [Thaumasiovibrio sp. DFM-14]|uniref:RHS repeat-associated core domain-containing protein n=1 Tax=Thaumasiovibrio sp. DFM-14 TaxID=3384792 RepID=UPI0039A10158
MQHKQFIYADGKLIALNIQKHDSDNHLEDRQIRYLHYDALGSVDMITDCYGFIVERRSYDPWGKTRNIQWADEDDASTLRQFTLTNRGYTGHEQLPEVGMIHMNGRVYDQELGRFLSADPIIKSPYMTNSFNRYSYVTNNPLKYVDPTGFVLVEGSGQDDGLGRTSVDLGGPKDQRRESNRNNGRDRHHQGSDTSKNNSLISEPVDEQQITYSEIPSVESQAIINVIDEAIDYVTNIRAIEQGYYEVLNATRENFIGTLGSVSLSIGIGFVEKRIPGPNVANRAFGTHRQLKNAGVKDSHHVIQDAAAKNISGYNRMDAPAVQLNGPSTAKGSEHYIATQVQRQRGGGTYAAERRIGYKALRKAGLSKSEARSHIQRTDDYFGGLGVTPSTPMRQVGNRNR